MNRASYQKRLIQQKIAAHRDISRLELESLRTKNPVASAFSMGASVSSLLGGGGGRRGTILKSATAAAIPALILGLVQVWRRRSGSGGSGGSGGSDTAE